MNEQQLAAQFRREQLRRMPQRERVQFLMAELKRVNGIID